MIDLFNLAACAVSRATFMKSPWRVACNDCWRMVCNSRFKVVMISGVILAVVIVFLSLLSKFQCLYLKL